MLEKIFVYGTLRSGASNAHRMEGARSLGAARVRGELFRIDWYPGLKLVDAAEILNEDQESRVLGEIYEIDRGLLAKLDTYEGAEYRKVQVTAELLESSDGGEMPQALEVIVYEFIDPIPECQRIPSGDWLAQ